MNTCIISVDPGVDGGIAVQHHDGTVEIHKMPETPTDVCEIFRAAQSDAGINGCAVKAFVEHVGGYMGGAPGESGNQAPATAMWSFGRGFGQIEGMFIALKIPCELVRPQRWQKSLNIGTKGLARGNYTTGMTKEQVKQEKRRVSSTNGRLKTAWKNRLKDIAQRRFPELKVTLATSDALCLLMFVARLENIALAQPSQTQLI